MTLAPSARLAVLASGRGSNLAALLEAFPGQVAVVISNKRDAPALERARAAGIEALHVPWPPGGARDFEAAVETLLSSRQVTLVLLAGFMRLLSPGFTRAWHGRILNIHPSLLPAFPGLHAHAQALNAGAAFTGCSVHFVDAGCDTGEVILQKRVPVQAGDTEETLSRRLLPAEHEAYPQAVRLVLRGLAFPRPQPGEIEAEFGVNVAADAQGVRAARLLRDWGREDAVADALEGHLTPLTSLARSTDELRLAWTTLDSLSERRARWEKRGELLVQAETLGLGAHCARALAVTADEWDTTTY
ncbi:phosphoribosylglycinamide formyltransferase [Deinococcus peraridilitoris]|uniref:Phosphoribosylglycinamide formyltransferase n=1 Tax=Deinococcus peraridilitoris (strain DSM 19664 / LMG 22246 / CIP 109416 / KR-200) TaxID=937777 RepID=L0A4P1_DEIPD|nr:phosphoribosylglycinamide formyltransferase [Deinococcus peraridilitoris]AFZ68826.1 phosphoribosylglycinamide formyltransferase, formyltetrahydrofolate-dependent [Deinococcus peraridilitoris DSM 19664]